LIWFLLDLVFSLLLSNVYPVMKLCWGPCCCNLMYWQNCSNIRSPNCH